jgi:hypothetical protein
MSRLGDKYIAGFLDSDGCITMEWKEIKRNFESPLRKAHVVLKFAQLEEKDEVLYRIQEVVGGRISTRFMNGKCYCTHLILSGKDAEMTLSRIQKHLVVKRHIAGIALEMNGKVMDRKEGTEYFKMHRKIKSYPLPNFPTRQWLAGYFDGDGCFSVRLPKDRNAVQFAAEISASAYDSEGVELISKVFGGSINQLCATKKNVVHFVLTLPPSKAKQFVGYFNKHLIVKKEQSDFILGCADMGHYRDGISIKSAMKQLKAHPHRLNEPRPNASVFLKDVREMSGKELYKPRTACMI